MIQRDLPQGANLRTKGWKFDGFNLGVNNFSLATELSGNELASAQNAELYGKRSLRPRRGGTRLGTSVGDKINGLYQFKTNSVNYILGLANGVLKKYNSSLDSWDSISGATLTSGLRTRGIKLHDNFYLGNGTDPFTRFNGTLLEQFTTISPPSDLAVTPNGTTGEHTYQYQITAVTAKGESLPCDIVSIANGNDTLDATNNNTLTWSRIADSSVIGYNVYGRDNTGNGVALMEFIAQPSSGDLSWTDDGSVTPQLWLPPEGDSTGGIVGSLWEQLKGSLVVSGTPDNKDRLYFSGTGDYYESFSPAQNGGWVDVRPGDNDAGVNGLAPFEDKVIVAKQNSIHQFLFDTSTGDALIQEVISFIGCGAPGSMVVMENDIAFVDSDLKLRILGYEPNFTAGIRTTSLSEGRVQGLFNDIDPTYMQNMEAIYHNGRYYLAATTRGSTVNDMVLCYDRRYLAFLGRWSGADCKVGAWVIWDGKDRKKRLYAGGSDNGYIWEFNVEGVLTNNDGSAVQTTIKTRNEDLGNSGQQKIWKWADMRLYKLKGTLEIKTILNGATTLDTKDFSQKTSTGWGIKKWGTTKWGVSTGTGASVSDTDKTYRKEIYEIANSLEFEITKKLAQTDFILVSMQGEAFLLPTDVIDSDNLI